MASQATADAVGGGAEDEQSYLFALEFTPTMSNLVLGWVVAIATFSAAFLGLAYLPRRVREEVQLIRRCLAWMRVTCAALVGIRAATLYYKLSISEPVAPETVYGAIVPACGLVLSLFGLFVPTNVWARWLLALGTVPLIVADTVSEVYAHERLLCVQAGLCLEAATGTRPYLDDEGALSILALAYQVLIFLGIWSLLIDAYLIIAAGCFQMRYPMRALATAPIYTMVPRAGLGRSGSAKGQSLSALHEAYRRASSRRKEPGGT